MHAYFPRPGRFLRPEAAGGNSLAEYGIIGGVVMAAAIGVVLLMGQDLQKVLAALRGDLASPVTTARNVEAGLPPGAQGFGTVRITLSDGTRLNLSNYPLYTGQAIQTAGTSGTTDMIANALKQLARQLFESGEITEEQMQALLDMANAGHGMALDHAFRERAAASCDTPECFVGYQEPVPGGESRTNFNVGNAHAAEFLDAYFAAVHNGSLNNPTVNSVVTLMKENIIGMNNMMNNEVNELAYDSNGDGPGSTDLVSRIAGRYKEATQADAVNICSMGNGTDNGVLCQP